MPRSTTKTRSLRIGNVTLDGTPRLAASFADDAAVDTIRDASRRGLDIAELRIDLYASLDPQHVANEAQKFVGILPTIATIRSTAEGGKCTLADADRLEIFEAVLPHTDAIDIELSSGDELRTNVVAAAHQLDRIVIGSYHNFDETPAIDTLRDVVGDADENGVDVLKVATAINESDDVKRLAEFALDICDRNFVLIGMGPQGVLTRLLFPALGSLFTFAHIGEATAPGQLGLDKCVEVLRVLYTENS